ncbi:MAG: isoprenyl transferase [Desulfobacterales bacterium]
MNSRPPANTYGLDSAKLPKHVAVIMDGNGRWAKKRKLSRITGHNKGTDAVRSVVRTCRELGISFLTLYAFSTENWGRPAEEVNALMELLKRFLRSEEKELLENDIRLNHIGDIERLPADVRAELERVMKRTLKNDTMVLTLAVSYGGRSDIAGAVRRIAGEVFRQTIQPDDISEELISDYLYTRSMPDPDLVIRTSGESRISNFLLWQIAYSEIAITKTLWPDFSKEEFIQILLEYQNRERRFGKVSS